MHVLNVRASKASISAMLHYCIIDSMTMQIIQYSYPNPKVRPHLEYGCQAVL